MEIHTLPTVYLQWELVVFCVSLGLAANHFIFLLDDFGTDGLAQMLSPLLEVDLVGGGSSGKVHDENKGVGSSTEKDL